MKHDLWPTPLWHIEGAPQQLIDELYQGAYEFKKQYPPENRSNEGGYQTPPLEWKGFQSQGREYIDSSWWIAVIPGLGIACTVLSLNFIGDWLRDKLDPMLRQQIN